MVRLFIWIVFFLWCAFLSAGCGQSASSVVDASADQVDSHVDDVARAVDTPTLTFGFEARVLAASTCHGRTLRLLDVFRQRGFTTWHFCYVTEDPRVAADAGRVTFRAASVRFEVGGDGSFSLDPMVEASAPRTANPWTSSVVVALPDTIVSPRFNVRSDFAAEVGGGLSWALDYDEYGSLQTRGLLRAWRVDGEGRQTEVSLQRLFLVCGGPMGPSGYPAGNYVPEGSCPAALAMCALGPFHCRP